jgi:hypothetical protein
MPLNWNFPAKIGPKTGKQVTTNGRAGINSAPNVNAGINSATHLGGRRCRDHQDDGDDSTNDRKLADHNQLDVQGSCRDARVSVLDR